MEMTMPGDVTPIWIGYDPVESVAYHVLAHSLIQRAKGRVLTIGPVGNTVLPKSLWWRERGPHDTTQFSNARFMVPQLAGYRGWALYLDCDMVCLTDIGGLLRQADPDKAVMVVQHNVDGRTGTKGLGWKQTAYPRKNWSSLMLFNCAHAAFQRVNWLRYVNEANGLDLHQLRWAHDDEIGRLEGPWNTLVTPDLFDPMIPISNLPHFTLGGAWHGYTRYPYVTQWASELEEMLSGTNPCAKICVTVTNRTGLTLGGAYVPAEEAIPEKAAREEEA